ncbi:MAG: hypothetical protein ABR524_10160 [Thermoanaerobaculia bacterium]
MSSTEYDPLRTVVRTVLQKRSGSSDSESIVSAARGAHEDLAGVMVPLVGDVGLRALSSRAVHIAQRDFFSGSVRPIANDGTSDAIEAWLKQLEQSRVMEAALTMFSALGGLLGNFIGESLTVRLLQKAWPDGFPDPESKETQT